MKISLIDASFSLETIIASRLEKLRQDREFLIVFEPLDRFPQLVRDIFTTQPSPEAVSAVARTVWILWKDTPDKVWNIIRGWSLEGGVLLTACLEVVMAGFIQGHLDIHKALDKVDDWLVTGDPSLQEAAINLAPAILLRMDSDELKEVSSKWAMSGQVGHLRALSKAAAAFANKDPLGGTKTFLRWARYENGRLDGAIADALREVKLPANESREFYRSMDGLLLLLMFSMEGRSQRAVRGIQKLIAVERELTSQLGTKGSHKAIKPKWAKQKTM